MPDLSWTRFGEYEWSRAITGESAAVLGADGYERAAPEIRSQARFAAFALHEAREKIDRVLWSGHRMNAERLARFAAGSRVLVPTTGASADEHTCAIVAAFSRREVPDLRPVLLEFRPTFWAAVYRPDKEWIVTGSFAVVAQSVEDWDLPLGPAKILKLALAEEVPRA